ncbi:adenylate kinase 8-like isoform X2 [Marmota monax]|uniref:adenylate kinase 8-like isoform X2 n=1 Tax=Marmota monax TaxID=9995 RepID=UPI0026EA72DE|nr:adenylate kinase 8-like isoform X2 [Marmota monax]
MDATSAPHLIPPEMPQYGEEKHVFELMQTMLEQLLVYQPEDPISFLIKHLQRDNDNVPKIVILGPPASGKTTIAMWLCKHLSSNLLTSDNLIERKSSSVAEEARKHYQKSKGWILDGIPETREQALVIQTLGIAPRHVIVLSAPDTVLIERNLGKRIDPQTREIYHTTFDWPPELEVQNRLIEPEGISELETAQKLLVYHRNIIRILPSYPKILKTINADQPCVDVFYQALTFVQSGHRSNAPFTPRVLLLGPMGSGKRLQAGLLAQKYGLVNVCCGQLLKEAVADKSKIGELIWSFLEKKVTVPDSIIMKMLAERLDRQDCVQKGWVLHGVPRDLDQAQKLDSLGYIPNR